MSSSVFSEAPSVRPTGADGDSNLVVVYSKNGVSFDERAIGNIMEEKSISSISVVRLTSPTPSMVDQEEAERQEELERFLELGSDREDSEGERESDNESQSGADELISEKDHVTGDDIENSAGENNGGDSTETETEAPKIKKRPGRKPKAPKKQKKRRKPRERPPVVALHVEQFYVDGTADLVVKDALKLAGLSIFKRTAESDALLEIIRNDHNYTPYTSPEEMRAHKTSDKATMAREVLPHPRKFIAQTQSNIRLLNAKKRVQVIPLTPVSNRQLNQQQPLARQPLQVVAKQQQQKPQLVLAKRMVPVRVSAKPPIEESIEDDEDINSSATADEEAADTEDLSEASDFSHASDNDRDSDIDFKMNNLRGAHKRKRLRQLKRRNPAPAPAPAVAPKTPMFATSKAATLPLQQQLKRRKELAEQAQSQQPIPAKLPVNIFPLERNKLRNIVKMPAAHKTLPLPTEAGKLRRIPMLQVARVVNATTPTTPTQEVKEIVINKNLSSPKGVFTNLNTLLTDKATKQPQQQQQQQRATPTPRTIFSPSTTPAATTAVVSKGFMPLGVQTATSHKLPAQIVIETHQSSSELAAENDKQLDLINSIVQDELLKLSPVDKPAASADETIPQLVKMLESTAADLNQTPAAIAPPPTIQEHDQSYNADLNMDLSRLDVPDEDEITADFLQHVVGLIEEDKQFEAEVVKQVLAVAPPLYDGTDHQLGNLPQLNADFVADTAALANLPMACSTPARATLVPTTVPTPVATTATTYSPRCDVKVVRANGRIINLPPIEAPTTRAKRRAQNFPASDNSNITLSDSNITLDSNQSQSQLSSTVDSESVSVPFPGFAKRQLAREPARRPRRANKLNSSLANDADASESQEDDDDPNKLWCICRQPHNNRFMICCDLCEDWYHGTCVSVTKAMGLEMEQNGVDWKCPKCVKKQEEKNQPRITELLLPKSALETAAQTPRAAEAQIPQAEQQLATPKSDTSSSSSTNTQLKQVRRMLPAKPQPKMLHQQQLQFFKLGSNNATLMSNTLCVVCKRPARLNTVYCSDECIRKYAQSAVQAQTVAKTPEQATQQQAQQSAAATTATVTSLNDSKKNKKKDLFEDVLRQADSVSKVERINVFERRTGRAITGHLAPTAQHLKKWLQDNPTFEVVQPGSTQALEIEKRQNKRPPELTSTEPLSIKPRSPLPKANETLIKALPLSTASTAALVRKDKALPSMQPEPLKTQPEPIRLNVRRTLKEQLLARIKEAQAAELPAKSEWLSAADVEHFVKRVEAEMFHSFGREVNVKYKSKYRSLMFNIKDRKNKTLFDKICAKQVDPKQLVRMTAAELASQELAKWREEENKHQLDMIKKSELDMLSCAQNYVVKTHKGEEVIEAMLDVALPEEQTSSQELRDSQESNAVAAATDSKELKEKAHKVKSKERSRERDKERSGEKRHKSHKHARKRSHSRSRSSSVEKRSHKRQHDSNEHEREKDKEKLVVAHKKVVEKKTEPAPAAFSLIDQILESSKTIEQAANLKQPENPLKATARRVRAPVAVATASPPAIPLDLYERYVQKLGKAALWSGNINMVDVADFDVVIHPVHGNTQRLGNLLPNKLDVIGRITRDNVWDYLKKIRKSPTKEIVLLQLYPSSAAHTTSFNDFFEYLDTRQRLGVLGADSSEIRDFYIFPLGARDKVPSVLLPLESAVPFFENTKRPNTFLGIIVRSLNKRISNLSQTLPATLSTASNKTEKDKTRDRQMTTFTLPPNRRAAKRKRSSASSKDDEFDIDAIIKAPIAAKLQQRKIQHFNQLGLPLIHVFALTDKDDVDLLDGVEDPNAPYSPGGCSEDDELPASMTSNKNDLERKVDEINKQILAQRMEIAGLLNVEPSVLAQPSSSSNVLASISIPPNLTKILASLKAKSDTTVSSALAGDDEEYNPEDAISSSSSYGIGAGKSKSRLAQLSEAELLSMVPDNMLTDTIPTEPPPPGL
ncbi:pps [Drosophila busckii]|uniref:Pps n=2 Tax=Drosophila busckii TaxID=30019 RepID=A0A0M4F530_DROBS|nr:pps [Drosophila busckii]